MDPILPNRFSGKTAIVVGAGCVGPGWGNGRATAVRLAQEGAKVIAADINTDSLDETIRLAGDAGAQIIPSRCDATDLESVRQVAEQAIATFGQIDVLVNAVGGSAPGGAAEMSPELWNKQLLFNLSSVYFSCHVVIPHMQKQKAGAIVNLSSTSGLRYTGSAQAAYAAAKAAIIQFSKVTAVQYAADGIRVNTVCPGQLHTPMVEARLAGQRAGGDIDKLLESRLRRIPLGFMGDGRDTAHAVAYLASDEARFVTGTELIVDGGMIARCN